jgi:hypothetical protein
MNKTIYQAMKIAQVDARQLAPSVTPLSGWAKPIKSGKWDRLTFKAKPVKMGIKTKIDRARKRGTWTSKAYLLINADPAGAIYETAGRRNPQGRAPIMSTTLKDLGNVQGYEGKKSGKKRSTRDYNSNNPFAGYQFVSALEPVTSQPKTKGVRSGGVKTKGRLIYKAFANQSPQIYQAILNAINATAVDFNKSYDKKAA